LGQYLGVLNTAEYADFQLSLKSIVVIYLIFFILNLLTAAVTATRFNYRVKFWLAIIPAGILLVAPFLLAIPVSLKYPDRNYFEVYGALYRLFRYTNPGLLAMAFSCTFLAIALNVLAALMIRKAAEVEKVQGKIRNRYFIYAGVTVLIFALVVTLGSINAGKRSLDRAACNTYATLALPELDQEVTTFLSELLVIGQAAGNDSVKQAFANFSLTSRQYYNMIDSEVDDATLNQYALQTTAARDQVVAVCSEFAVK
jgi:F0F1-type ATP synthase membrane subunit c/vacuolar-type H+-ATPase subunit K